MSNNAEEILKNNGIFSPYNNKKLNSLLALTNNLKINNSKLDIFYSPKVFSLYPNTTKNNNQSLSFTTQDAFFIGAFLSHDEFFHIYSDNKELVVDANITDNILKNYDTISKLIYNIKEASQISCFKISPLNIFIENSNIEDNIEYFTLLLLKAINHYSNDDKLQDIDIVKACIWCIKSLISSEYQNEKIITPILSGVVEYNKNNGSYGKGEYIQNCSFFKEYSVYQLKLKNNNKKTLKTHNIDDNINLNQFSKLSKIEIVDELKSLNKDNKTILDTLFKINLNNQDNKTITSFKKATYTQFIKLINIRESERSFYNTDAFYNSDIYKLLYMIFKENIYHFQLSIITDNDLATFLVSKDILKLFKTTIEKFKNDVDCSLIKPSSFCVNMFSITNS